MTKAFQFKASEPYPAGVLKVARAVDGHTAIVTEYDGQPLIDGAWIVDGKIVADYVPPEPEKPKEEKPKGKK